MTWRDMLKAYAFLPRLDIERLGAHIMGKPRPLFLAYIDTLMTHDEEEAFQKGLLALQEGIPIQYLLHEAWFYGRAFYVDERVLIPRFDTEVLVDAVLSWCSAKTSLSILDLCTGSGIVAITLAKEHAQSNVYASDISEAALKVAKRNGEIHQAGVQWRLGDLFSPWQGKAFDSIVANPPYISFTEYDTLDDMVKKEPKLALCAENDGLDFYARITKEATEHLADGGLLAVEIGARQEEAVRNFFLQRGYADVQTIYDEQDFPRVILGTKGKGGEPCME